MPYINDKILTTHSSPANSTPASAAASPKPKSTASRAKTPRSVATSTSSAAKTCSKPCSRRWNPCGSSKREKNAPRGANPRKSGERAGGTCSKPCESLLSTISAPYLYSRSNGPRYGVYEAFFFLLLLSTQAAFRLRAAFRVRTMGTVRANW